jgi:hypothetical protein
MDIKRIWFDFLLTVLFLGIRFGGSLFIGAFIIGCYYHLFETDDTLLANRYAVSGLVTFGIVILNERLLRREAFYAGERLSDEWAKR